ncbi:MAG: SPASM domain-containing protein [Phycisphaerae bacterium]|nr:SPASM domain-containing protein [Phycisphaerae bacterium]
MSSDGKSGTGTALKRLRVLGRYYVYNPVTARHAELQRGQWCEVGAMMQGGKPITEKIKALPELAPIFEKPQDMSGAKSTPVFKNLILQVSNTCNLRCLYCSADFGRYGGDFRNMSACTAEQAIDFLFHTSPSNELAITYFGGEPLLNLETVLSSARHARRKAAEQGRSLSLHLVTNGVLLSAPTLLQLDEQAFSLTVSMDGPETCHDRYRPFADSSGSLQAIRRCLEIAGHLPIGARITLRGTFTRQSAAFLSNIRFLVESGFSRNIAYEPVFLPAVHPLALRWRDLSAVKRAYADLARYYVGQWRRGKPFCLWDFDDAIIRLARAKPRLSRCGAGITTLAVTAERDIYACHMSTGLEDAKLGNLEQGLIENLQRPWREKYFNGRTGCVHCWLRALCGGGCSTHALFYNHCLGHPYRLECELIEQRYRLALWILSEIPELKKKLSSQDAAETIDTGHLLPSPLWSYRVNDHS